MAITTVDVDQAAIREVKKLLNMMSFRSWSQLHMIHISESGGVTQL